MKWLRNCLVPFVNPSIIDALRNRKGTMTSQEIEKEVHLAHGTVQMYLQRGINLGLIEKNAFYIPKKGRPKIFFHLTPLANIECPFMHLSSTNLGEMVNWCCLREMACPRRFGDCLMGIINFGLEKKIWGDFEK